MQESENSLEREDIEALRQKLFSLSAKLKRAENILEEIAGSFHANPTQAYLNVRLARKYFDEKIFNSRF